MRLASLFTLLALVAAPALAQSGVGGVSLNEIRIDNPGTDVDEYFELIGAPNGTLSELWYVVIGDGAGGSGVVEEALSLTGATLDGNGFFVGAEATFTLGTADSTFADINFENSDNVTHMIVSFFTGAIDDDLDTDDDGVLDVTPWASMQDCVALVEEVGAGDQIYCTTTVGPDGTFVPGHVYVEGCCTLGNGWVIGPFDPVGGEDTPGFQNIPVELVSFSATVDGADVNLYWETASETNNAGFEVQMRPAGQDFTALGFVDGNGTTTEAQTYGYTVPDLAAGSYTLRLKQIDYDGAFEYSPEVEVAVGLPGSHVLTAAYPNPFNPSATFSLSVAAAQRVDIGLYNALGQRVATVFAGPMEAGQARAFTIEAGALPSGPYFYRAVGETFAETGRAMLLK